MDDIMFVVLVGVIAMVAGNASGAGFEQKMFAKGIMFLLFSFFATGVLAIGTHLYLKKATILSLTPTKEEVYFVLKKVPDEKGAFLVLFDTKNNNERVAHLSVYPPEGYSETALPDGRTVLAVTGRQIVAGDPNKADFVPPKK